MAQTRSFKCQGCGYSGSTTIGGGFRNHLTHSPFPALCRCCVGVRSINAATSSAADCMTCGSTDVTEFGLKTRSPEENEELTNAAQRNRCREVIRVKVILRRAVRRGELTQEQIADEELDGERFMPNSDPPWHVGRHLCPRCNAYALQFSAVTMFLD